MPTPPVPPHEALRRLLDGNQRFVASIRGEASEYGQLRPAALPQGQAPFAVVLGCSDSRVPAELVFDQGLGDLFVIRVAGNVVAPSQLGSIEFAYERFGTALVIVLGHTECGAVDATLEHALSGAEGGLDHQMSIVSRIRPAVLPLLGLGAQVPRAALMRAAVRANILMSVEHVRRSSVRIEKMVGSGDLVVVGAEYDLRTGVVELLDAPRARRPTDPPPE